MSRRILSTTDQPERGDCSCNRTRIRSDERDFFCLAAHGPDQRKRARLAEVAAQD